MKRWMFALWGALAFLAVRAEAATLFDATPGHPWNRLYDALQNPPATDLSHIPFDAREVFPADAKYAEIITALDAFTQAHAEKMINAPLKRAILLSRVWATFDQAADPTAARQPERDQVARRCAEIIRRLALTDAEIDALPDNFTAAVKQPGSGDGDHTTADAPLLPADLLDARGPWVLMAGEWPDPAAVQHVRVVQGRSQFYVFIRLPGDRAATLGYLRALASFPQPYEWNEQYSSQPYNLSPLKPNHALPDFPKGTAVALLRQMILPDDRGELRLTPITESLQLRVYVTDPKEVKCCDDIGQKVFAFRLDAAELLQGKTGLVRAKFDELPVTLAFEKPSLLVAHMSCQGCHGEAGVRSFLTYTHRLGPPRHTPWFEPGLPQTQDRHTLEWKQRQYSWGLLRGMIWAPPAVASPGAQ